MTKRKKGSHRRASHAKAIALALSIAAITVTLVMALLGGSNMAVRPVATAISASPYTPPLSAEMLIARPPLEVRMHASASPKVTGTPKPVQTHWTAPPVTPVPRPTPTPTPTPTPSATSQPVSGTLSCSGLESLWERAGGNPAYAFTAAEVAMAESGGNQYAHSPTDDFGYWQINGSWGPAMATYDALGNAEAAVVISHNGTDWYPWTTYTSGAYAGKC